MEGPETERSRAEHNGQCWTCWEVGRRSVGCPNKAKTSSALASQAAPGGAKSSHSTGRKESRTGPAAGVRSQTGTGVRYVETLEAGQSPK